MPAPKGNKFAINNSGRGKDYDSPGELAIDIELYFEDLRQRPIKMWHTQLDKKTGEPVQIQVERPATIEGLCAWLKVDRKTLLNYQKQEGYEDYFHIIDDAKRRITQSKTEGALVGAYKENFTKFLLINNSDYVDKVEQKVTQTNTNYNSEPMTPDEMKQIGDALEKDF